MVEQIAFTLRLSPERHEAAMEAAKARGLSLNAFINSLLARRLPDSDKGMTVTPEMLIEAQHQAAFLSIMAAAKEMGIPLEDYNKLRNGAREIPLVVYRYLRMRAYLRKKLPYASDARHWTGEK